MPDEPSRRDAGPHYGRDVGRGLAMVALVCGLLLVSGWAVQGCDDHHQTVRAQRVDIYARDQPGNRSPVVVRLGYKDGGTPPVACGLDDSSPRNAPDDPCTSVGARSVNPAALRPVKAAGGPIIDCRVEDLECIDLQFIIPNLHNAQASPLTAADPPSADGEKPAPEPRDADGNQPAVEGSAEKAWLDRVRALPGWIHIGWVIIPTSPDRPDYAEQMQVILAYQRDDEVTGSSQPVEPMQSVLIDANSIRPDGPQAVLRSTAASGYTPSKARGFALHFGKPYGALHSYGSLPEKLSALFASFEHIVTNLIIALLGVGLCVVPIALFALQLQTREGRFLPTGWRSPLVLSAKNDTSKKLEQVKGFIEMLEPREDGRRRKDVDGQAIRDDLTKMAQRMDRSHLAIILQRAIDEWRCALRLPTESLDTYLDDLAERLECRVGITLLDFLATAAPALGFLGTAIGMARAFQEMNTVQIMGDGGFATAMKVALITTILGLVLQILALAVLRIDEGVVTRRLSHLRSTALLWMAAYHRALARQLDDEKAAAKQTPKAQPS